MMTSEKFQAFWPTSDLRTDVTAVKVTCSSSSLTETGRHLVSGSELMLTLQVCCQSSDNWLSAGQQPDVGQNSLKCWIRSRWSWASRAQSWCDLLALPADRPLQHPLLSRLDGTCVEGFEHPGVHAEAAQMSKEEAPPSLWPRPWGVSSWGPHWGGSQEPEAVVLWSTIISLVFLRPSCQGFHLLSVSWWLCLCLLTLKCVAVHSRSLTSESGARTMLKNVHL